jgi:transcription elongation GreA/GreB family factor
MAKQAEVMLTPDGRAMLHERMTELAEQILPAMRPLLVEEERDERVVADFERAQAEHDRLAVLLGTAGTIDTAALGESIALGTRVAIEGDDGARRVVRIVDPVEAFLDDERISSASPLAVALLGHRVGDSVPVGAPAGVWTAQVIAVGEDVPAS